MLGFRKLHQVRVDLVQPQKEEQDGELKGGNETPYDLCPGCVPFQENFQRISLLPDGTAW